MKILLIISGDVCEEISLNISVFCSGFIYGFTPSSEKIIAYIYMGVQQYKGNNSISGRKPKNEPEPENT